MDALSRQCYQQVCPRQQYGILAHLLVDRAVGHRRLREQLVLLLLDLLLAAQQRLINRATSVG
jgi:hypothetical protein